LEGDIMSTIKLILANVKRYIKNPSILVSMALMPFVVVLGVNSLSNDLSDSNMFSQIAIVADQNGEYESGLIRKLNLEKNIFSLDQKSEAVKLLKENKVSAVFVFDKDFSKNINKQIKPKVECIKTSKGSGSLFAETEIESYINDSLKELVAPGVLDNKIASHIVEKKSVIPDSSFLIVFMICYMMYISTTALSRDLMELKYSNVLTRLLSTKNKNLKIMFSLFFSIFSVQAIVYSILLVLLNIITGVELNLNMLALVLANCFTSTGLVLFMVRFFKTESNLASMNMFAIFYSIVSIALCINKIIPSFNSDFINNLAKFTPFYWTIDALTSTNNILINLISILLIGLVFLTAGSFKLRDFVRS
jgi:ABC-2 type transport system permease protein